MTDTLDTKFKQEQEIRQFCTKLPLEELDKRLESARTMFFESVVEGETADTQRKFLNAYKLASDIYFGRKYGK